MENIYWTGGFDSTFLVCKRLIIEKKPIETYYLNFSCDGYDKTFNKFPSTNFDKMMSNNTNVNIQDPWYNKKSYGRYSRFIEVKVMKKLRKMIIDKFPYTKDLFPKTKLIKKFEIDKEVLNYSKRLANYDKRWKRADQTLYMCQFSLDLDDKIEVSYEADVSNPDGVTYSVATQLVRENLDENLEVKLNSNYFHKELNKLKEKFPKIIKEVRGRGLLIGLQLYKDQTIFIKNLMDNKLLTIKAGENTIRILPPLTVKKNEIKQAIKIINKVCLSYQ